jgi:hypothetical protein
MIEIPEEQKASKPVGVAVLLGLIVGSISHELFLSFAPAYQWFSVVAFVPGFYLLRIWIKAKLKSMNVIESDEMTITRKLRGKVTYSESFSIVCTLIYTICFFLISIGGNVIVITYPEESASIFDLIDLIGRLTL